MGTKEEIEKFLKDLQINPKYIVFNFNEGSQYDLGDIIQRALDHFKPKPVTSQEKLKEIREMIKYILPTPDCNDSEIVETYTETIMSIFSQDKTVISDSEIEERIEKTIQQTVYPIVGSIELNYFKKSLRKALYKDLKWMRSKLSTTVTEPKEDCICSDEEICHTCFESKGWIVHEGSLVKQPKYK